MHHFSYLFWYRTLRVSERLTVHHQESSTVYTAIGICHACYADCMLAKSGWIQNVKFIHIYRLYTYVYIDR